MDQTEFDKVREVSEAGMSPESIPDFRVMMEIDAFARMYVTGVISTIHWMLTNRIVRMPHHVQLCEELADSAMDHIKKVQNRV